MAVENYKELGIADQDNEPLPDTEQSIVDTLNDTQLSEIAEQVYREYEIDEANFQSRKDRIEELYKLALQVTDAKDYPWPNASNIKYPIITEAALAFSAMAYPSIVTDDQVVRAKIIGNDDGDEVIKDANGKAVLDPDTGKEVRKNEGLKQKRADRVSKFMSHQVLNDMDGWEDDMDKILLINPIIGSTFKKTYYDPLERKNVSKLVLPQFLVINIDAVNVESASRVSELIQMYPHEIRSSINMGVFKDFDYAVSNETLKDNYKQGEDESAHNVDETKPHLFIEQHRRIDLDDDGYPEPYIVWMHKESREIVRILPRFDDEDVIKSGSRIIKIRTQGQYTKIPFIPDPEGSPYDIGFGHLLQHLNEAANTSINQMIDQGHRYTMGGGFIGDGLRMKSGNMRFKPGEWKRVKTTGVSVRESMVPLPMPEPSTVLMVLIESLIKAAKDLASMNKVMAGDIPPNMPAATALASIEQGMQPFKAVYKRIHRALKKEFKKLFYLNQQYLTQEEYMKVLDDEAADVERDFDTDTVDVIPLSDPEMLTNTQSLMKSQFLMQFLNDPTTDSVELRKRIFTLSKIKDTDDLIKMPQQAPDPIVEAQIAALQSQIVTQKNDAQVKQREADRKDADMRLKVETSIIEMKNKIADTVLKIAQAEAAEEGAQLAQYKQQMDEFQLQLDVFNQLKKGLENDGTTGQPSIEGGVGELAEQPGNAEIL